MNIMGRRIQNNLKNKYTADFETTKEKDPETGETLAVRVWNWGINGIEDLDFFEEGDDLDSFMEYIETMGNVKLYFHNLKYDGAYLVDWLFKHGFALCMAKDLEPMYDRCFSTTISDMGLFYKIRIVFNTEGKKKHFVEIYDSLKVLPFKVKQVAKAFDLPIKKGEIDYEMYRPVGYHRTQEELEYIMCDVKIMAMALRVLFEQGLTKMTQASNALFDYKKMIGETNFNNWFPTPDYDEDVRKAYKGGFTWLNLFKYANKDVRCGLVLDVNSLYPWVMHDCLLPYRAPIKDYGKYEYDEDYPLYVQQLLCRFTLKKDHIPTIQIKEKDSGFLPTEYLTSNKRCVWIEEDEDYEIIDEPVLLTLTSVDLQLFFDHYDVEVVEWLWYYKFQGKVGMFTDYIDKWIDVKIQATKDGNAGMRTLAKLMLNALYGKFATSIYTCSKIPKMEDDVVSYELGEPERKPDKNILYIPVGAFITAYAREKTIRSGQKVFDKFIYADTDSLHLEMDLPPELDGLTNKDLEKMTTEDFRNAGVDFPDDFDIDPYALGAWKVESRFFRGKYIRAKTYIEDWNRPELWDRAGKDEFNSAELKEYCEDNDLDFKEELKKHEGEYDRGVLNITCAGMPESCYKHVSWDNFTAGQSYPDKLMPRYVNGGVSLEPVVFTIKP